MTSHGIGGYAKDGKLIVEKYRLGIVAQPLTGDERFMGMLCIPYDSRAGVKTIKYRTLSGPKVFAQPTGQKQRLYNTRAYFEAEDIIGLVEGEIDAINASEVIGVPTMGIGGAEQWRGHRKIWAPVFKDFRMVVMFADGDDAGHELAKDVGESVGWRLRVINCPQGEDVSSLVAAGRADVITRKAQLATEDK